MHIYTLASVYINKHINTFILQGHTKLIKGDEKYISSIYF